MNTGHRNTGHRNTGHRNTGHRNTGHRNTGHSNTGHYNTGNYNTGHYNTGNYNTGHCNTGHYNTGHCNTDTPNVRLFNKDSGYKFGSLEESRLYFTIKKYQKSLCEWISATNMTGEEKKNNPKWEITQGYLKVNENTFNSNDVTEEDEEYFRSLPNFDEQILKQTTGIDLSRKTVKITIDGKDILISKTEFENIKAQFCE